MLNDEFENEDGYVKIDKYNQKLVDSISTNYNNIITDLGENSKREGLLKTPACRKSNAIFNPRIRLKSS